jgi:hypothetical protein
MHRFCSLSLTPVEFVGAHLSWGIDFMSGRTTKGRKKPGGGVLPLPTLVGIGL